MKNAIHQRTDWGNVIKKSAQVVMARELGELTLLDRKLFNFLMSNAKPSVVNQGIYSVKVSSVLDFTDGASTQRLNQSLERLGKVHIELDYIDQNDVRHSARMHLLSYDLSHTSNGTLYYAFDKMLIQFISDPKVFSAINLEIMKQFNNRHAVKLYEIMSMYEKRFNPTWNIGVDEFRDIFGISSNKHIRFDNLKHRVIEEAIDEVNKIATFDVVVDYVKAGRGGKISSLEFKALPKSSFNANVIFSNSGKSQKNNPRDSHTVDLIDGMTDAEKQQSIILNNKTKEDAIEMIGERGHIDYYEDKWHTHLNGRKVVDPNVSFLAWLEGELQESDNNAKSTKVFDNNVFADLLNDDN